MGWVVKEIFCLVSNTLELFGINKTSLPVKNGNMIKEHFQKVSERAVYQVPPFGPLPVHEVSQSFPPKGKKKFKMPTCHPLRNNPIFLNPFRKGNVFPNPFRYI